MLLGIAIGAGVVILVVGGVVAKASRDWLRGMGPKH